MVVFLKNWESNELHIDKVKSEMYALGKKGHMYSIKKEMATY